MKSFMAELFNRRRCLTTHSTGARVSLHFIENLPLITLNARPVNSGVRRYVVIT